MSNRTVGTKPTSETNLAELKELLDELEGVIATELATLEHVRWHDEVKQAITAILLAQEKLKPVPVTMTQLAQAFRRAR